ncbi:MULTISPECIES: DUF1643 domain-containing protein [Methylobacterium]|uniref:Uncharacterized protein conserved in bacteria n=1 Tax=Methylobacterium aquaticum TaxID=270351 RepID=A0A1Y0ZG36_9HYPH|nr:uncharacterized protein conserved in bacteria [Methylobacterium aquaticum]
MSAIISACGLYRLRLDRVIGMFDGPTIGFCLHNPSTADGTKDDPTSRRGIGFARSWGASRLVYVNPWAGRATKPAALWQMDDPVGPKNDLYIQEAARECAHTGGFMVVAWGSIKPPSSYRAIAQERLAQTLSLIRAQNCEVRALGVNLDGSPKHPLYARGDAEPRPWPHAPVL